MDQSPPTPRTAYASPEVSIRHRRACGGLRLCRRLWQACRAEATGSDTSINARSSSRLSRTVPYSTPRAQTGKYISGNTCSPTMKYRRARAVTELIKEKHEVATASSFYNIFSFRASGKKQKPASNWRRPSAPCQPVEASTFSVSQLVFVTLPGGEVHHPHYVSNHRLLDPLQPTRLVRCVREVKNVRDDTTKSSITHDLVATGWYCAIHDDLTMGSPEVVLGRRNERPVLPRIPVRRRRFDAQRDLTRNPYALESCSERRDLPLPPARRQHPEFPARRHFRNL